MMQERAEKKRKLLIVDDEPDFVGDVKGALESEVTEVVAVVSKTEAEQIAKTTALDLIILGTLTPRGEAFALHQWLRANPKTRDLPLIVMDAAPERQLVKGWRRDEAALMEAEEYLTKPVESGALATRAESILARAAKRIRVLIVDDHSVLRDGIRSYLGQQSDIVVVGEAENGKVALEKVRDLSPDVVLMDIVMPEMDGFEATKRIYEEYSQTRVVMLSQYDDEENILASERIGAHGFIPKRAAGTQLLNGIRAVHYIGERLRRPSTG
jgi:DNA-binding NarL/FixJ family response regulator